MIEILGTGELFTGYGVRSIGVVIGELVRSAKNEIQVMAYLITSPDFIDLLVEAAEKGIKITAIINSLSEQPVNIKNKLENATGRFPYFRVREFSAKNKGNLHAKVIVVDREKAIVGSANFTRSGIASGNHEIAVLVRGKEAEKLAGLIDRLEL